MTAIRRFVATGLALFAALWIAAHCQACGALKSSEAEATFLGQQVACIDKYETKADIDRCRRRVQAAWAGDAGDGGGQ